MPSAHHTQARIWLKDVINGIKEMNSLKGQNREGGSLARVKVGEDVQGRGTSTDESLKPQHLLNPRSRSLNLLEAPVTQASLLLYCQVNCLVVQGEGTAHANALWWEQMVGALVSWG